MLGLDKTEFSVTIEAKSFQWQFPDVLKLFSALHAEGMFFFIKEKTDEHVLLGIAHPKAIIGQSLYPVDIITPIASYEAFNNLKSIPDPFVSFDGSSVRAFLVKAVGNGLKIQRHYLYAGK